MAHTTPTKSPVLPAEPQLWGLMAEYDDAGSLMAAAEKVRDAGYKRWDCHTPFPVHGLDRAMGVRPTIMPWLVLGGGLTGTVLAIFMQWYVNSPHTTAGWLGSFSGFPMTFAGKPFWSLPANIPIIFELTVLLASLTAFFGLWALCGLPRLYYPAFSVQRFRRATDDKFFIIIEARDTLFDAETTRNLLAATHQTAIEEVKD